MGLNAFATCGEIAGAVRSGRARSRDMLELYLDRCANVGRALNAVVTIDADSARLSADACDRAVAQGTDLGPLHGVPMTVKDAFATAGLRSTSGMREYADDVPASDAVAAARLRAAGAVIFGKTNVPPEITGQETANNLFGRSVNPWDPARTPGGSSGGAAAAVAAGLTGMEVGSDSGGSIRQPAHCCGIFGHTPTHGMVPLRGHRPQVPMEHPGKDVDLMDVGPLARSSDDLALLLGVLAGDDPRNGGGVRFALESPTLPLASMRVGIWADDEACPSSSDVRDAMHNAATELRRRGITVDDTVRPSFSLASAWDVAFRLWVAASSGRTDDAEFSRLSALAQRTDNSDWSQIRAAAETMTHRAWLRLDEQRRELQRGWAELFERVDVILTPVIPVVAPVHDPVADLDLVASVDHRLAQCIKVDGTRRPYLEQLTWNIVTGMAGLPATATPLGLSPSGLPVGAQVVGPRYGDLTTIRVAGEINALVGGVQRPPGY